MKPKFTIIAGSLIVSCGLLSVILSSIQVDSGGSPYHPRADRAETTIAAAPEASSTDHAGGTSSSTSASRFSDNVPAGDDSFKLDDMIDPEKADAIPDERLLADLRVWIVSDPDSCLDWILVNLQDAGRNRALEEVVAHRSGESAEAAFEWLQRLSSLEGLDGPISAAFAALADADPAAAADWLESNPSSASRDNLGSLIDRWALADSESAFQWINLHLEGDMIISLLPNLLLGFGDSVLTDKLLSSIPQKKRNAALEVAISAVDLTNLPLASALSKRIENLESTAITP